MAFPFFGRKEPVIGSDARDALYLGRYRDPATGEVGAKIQVPRTEPVVIIGRNQVGKDAGIGNVNALQREGISTVWVDPRAQCGAISAPYRRKLGPVLMANAFGQCANIPGYADLKGTTGINFLDAPDLDPANPLFFDLCCGLAEAGITAAANDHNRHFSLASQELWGGGSMQEIKVSKRENRKPLLANVYDMIMEPAEYDQKTGEPVKGLAASVRRIVAEGDPQISRLLGRYAEKQTEETAAVVATYAAQSRWKMSQPLRDDEARGGIDFSELGRRPCSLYLCLPHELVETHSTYLRMAISSALRPLFAPHKVPVSFWLNEFYALGRLPAVESAIGLVAGSGIQIIIVVQSLSMLKQLYSDAWEAFLGNAGAIVLIGSPGDKFTADYLSARSGETTIRQPNHTLNLNSGGVGLSSGAGFGRRQHLSPHDLYGIRRGTGWIWLAGLADPLPAAFPGYYDAKYWPELSRRARRDPYYRG
jgi:type IV secretion system protein VirD4